MWGPAAVQLHVVVSACNLTAIGWPLFGRAYSFNVHDWRMGSIDQLCAFFHKHATQQSAHFSFYLCNWKQNSLQIESKTDAELTVPADYSSLSCAIACFHSILAFAAVSRFDGTKEEATRSSDLC